MKFLTLASPKNVMTTDNGKSECSLDSDATLPMSPDYITSFHHYPLKASLEKENAFTEAGNKMF